MITKTDIQNILQDLAKNSTEPYLSEAQLQFDLAWELQTNATKYDIKKIFLENTALIGTFTTATGTSSKRFEYDIIVLFNDNTFIAIELKYKTSEADINGVQLVQQAGQPGTKYDYIWDIRRIELLKNNYTGHSIGSNEYKQNSNTLKDAICSGGYAIFLTNDGSYYNTPRKGTAYDFRLKDKDENGKSINRIISCKDTLKWDADYPLADKDWRKSREEPITLDGDYELEWEKSKYYTGFNYLITEIK